ncbi:MAG: radical SAM protein [Planctomycetota bacterium]
MIEPSHDTAPRPRQIEGFVDNCDCMSVSGWCWDAANPDHEVELSFTCDGVELGRTKANKFRRDLLLAGKGTGRYGYFFELPREFLSRTDAPHVEVAVVESGQALVGSPAEVRMKVGEMIISPVVFDEFREGPKLDFHALRIDISNTCNLSCVYCPTIALRTKDKIDLEEFTRFLEARVEGVDEFALGCGQEPTTNMELADFMEAIAASGKAKPRDKFMLVTNGTLLHKHDWKRFKEAGLNTLFLSLDSMDADILGDVRVGSKLPRILENVEGVLEAVPGLELRVNVVVTTKNIGVIEDVVEWAWKMDAATVTLREMYFPPTTKVPDEKLFELMVQPGEFDALRKRVIERWGHEKFEFADRLHLEEEYAYWAPKLV